MMSNLFSIFETNTNTMIELNWLSSLFIMLFLPQSFWFYQSKIFILNNMLSSLIHKELKNIFIYKFNYSNSILFVSMFMFIMMNNLSGLFPYIFTNSSHMIFSISMSLPLWIGLMIFSWSKNLNFMFYHMIPQGTPEFLMPFMVLIETISNVIRPWTLTIRLTANMIAGHLLLTLMSQSTLNINFIASLTIISLQLILLILELSVSLIQSYVFTILSSLYAKETN